MKKLRITIDGKAYDVTVESLDEFSFDGIELVLMEVESPIAREWAPIAVAAGATVIDNSSGWRMDPEVPLVVAEVVSTLVLYDAAFACLVQIAGPDARRRIPHLTLIAGFASTIFWPLTT